MTTPLLDNGLSSNYNLNMSTYNSIFSLIATARSAANTYLQRELNAHGLSGLVPTHGSILHALINNEQLTMKELAAIIRRDKSTVTALVRKLEEMGYVRRCPYPEDNRISLVRITEAGLALKKPFEDISTTFIQTGLKGLTEDEKEHLAAALKVIISNFE